MSKLYHTRPSVLLCVEDEYTAYCLDEACAYILIRVEKGDKPKFERRYASFREMYSDLY